MPAFIVARDGQPEPASMYVQGIAEGFAALGAEQRNSLVWFVRDFAGTTHELLARVQSFMDPAVGVAVLQVQVNDQV